MSNKQLNIPLLKLFNLTYNENNDIKNTPFNKENDNDDINNNNLDNNKYIRKNIKKLKTQKFNSEMLHKMKKLNHFLINSQ